MKRVLGAVGTLLVLTALDAKAQPSVAEALFREGKQLMDEKRYDVACPKLEESQRLDPGGGTLLTLALCHEALGKSASAWAEFHEGLGAATRDHREDRRRVAMVHIRALSPTLSHLTVKVPDSVRSLGGLVVLEDGVELRAAAWGVPAPVDPGTHRIEVRATDKQPLVVEREVAGEGASETLVVPDLVDRAPPPAAAAPPPAATGKPPVAVPRVKHERPSVLPKPEQNDTWRTLGWVSIGVGVVSVGVGSFFGLRAISKSKQANQECPSNACENGDGVAVSEEAGRAADVSTVSFVVGAAALAFAGYAFLAHPAPTPSRRAAHEHRLTGIGFEF
jgi:hypothetical protein